MTRPLSRPVLAFLAAAALASPLLVASPAHAAGSISVARKELQESNGSWKIFVTIKLPKKPVTPTQPMRFIFTPKVIYETFLDDAHGDQEQTRSIPQGNDVQPLTASVDVNFADMSGKLWDTTKFDFTVRRDNGFQAGEYKVEVRDNDNNKIGSPFDLKLGGKNDVVDRRAIVMADPSKKKKKEAPPDEKKDAPVDAKSDAPADTGAAKTAPEGDEKKDGAQPPPPVEGKPGGCGCAVPGGAPGMPAGVLAIAAVAVTVARRRKRLGSRPKLFGQLPLVTGGFAPSGRGVNPPALTPSFGSRAQNRVVGRRRTNIDQHP